MNASEASGADFLARAWLRTVGHVLVSALLVAGLPISLNGQATSSAPPGAPTLLPTMYSADRFILTPLTESGDTLFFFTDTGGGANMIFPGAALRLGLRLSPLLDAGDGMATTPIPEWRSGASIPPPHPGLGVGDRFLVPPAPCCEGIPDSLVARDGFLASIWHADRIWLFDYPNNVMGIFEDGPPPLEPGDREVSLGFQEDDAGNRLRHFPSIPIVVDGDSIDFLFDTGATMVLKESALAALADGGPRVRAGSFVTRLYFDTWRSRHPDWRVIDDATEFVEASIIEVPQVTIAGYEVGPVWFQSLPDRNYSSDQMSGMMDRKIEGALGGTAFRYFRIVADYPRGIAIFRPEAEP